MRTTSFSKEKKIYMITTRQFIYYYFQTLNWEIGFVNQSTIAKRLFCFVDYPNLDLSLPVCCNSKNSLYVISTYAGGWLSLSTNSGAGLITVSSDGPWGKAMDILVALSFTSARCSILLHLPLLKILQGNIMFRKFWLIHKIIHLVKYSLGLNAKSMISEIIKDIGI